ncbi:hypothetical protein RSAG8_13708, partial [Rhizoctonia solani AG-8 WAC10335]
MKPGDSVTIQYEFAGIYSFTSSGIDSHKTDATDPRVPPKQSILFEISKP